VDFLELTMRVARHTGRGLTLATAAALLTTTACATATAAPAHAGLAGRAAPTPGWRVIKTFGPGPDNNLTGLLTAESATGAWLAWSGSSFTAVDHWTRGAWRAVPLPARLDGYVATAVSIGASSASNVWLFGTYRTTEALRWTGSKWVLQPIPSWVLPKSSSTVNATSEVFGPGNVWVFGAGAYAAHYNGRRWVKMKLPEVPTDVSAAGPGDIWALGSSIGYVMHWNGKKWATVRLPVLPLPVGASVSYSDMTTVGPDGAWLFRSISFPGSPIPGTAMMHWNGKAWLTVASPADIVGSVVPDGHGGLWADGIDINPGGFWYLYHLVRGHWTQFTPPGVNTHAPETLTWIPGTRSVWAVGSTNNAKGFYGVILKYGP
jgi:hypothetical protein